MNLLGYFVAGGEVGSGSNFIPHYSHASTITSDNVP